MADMTMTVTGLDVVGQALQALGPKAREAGGWALYQEALDILKQSQPLVPVDTGLLKSSGQVERTADTGSQIVMEISYGDHGLVPYAAVVHSDVIVNHPRGGQAHYLSEPYFAATAGMLDRLAGRIRARMR